MCDSSSHGTVGVGAVVLDALTACLWKLLTFCLWKSLQAAGFITAVAAVIAYRWFGGAPMWGAAAWPDGWSRWRRGLARTAVTAVVTAGAMWPWPTAAALAATGSITCLAVLERRRRQAAARAALAARKPIAAITAVPHQPALTVAALLEGTRS